MRKNIPQVKVARHLQPGARFVSAAAGIIFALGSMQLDARGAEAALAGGEGAARMQAARDEVGNVRSNIVLTLLELYRIKADRDPARPQFQVFTNQLERMQEVVKRFAGRAEEMKQRGTAYFADWEVRAAAIQDQRARDEANQQYAERKKSYDEINQFMQSARKPFLAFVDELTKIRTLVQGERNQKTIAQAEDAFTRANWECLEVQRALMEVELRFSRLAESFAKELDHGGQR